MYRSIVFLLSILSSVVLSADNIFTKVNSSEEWESVIQLAKPQSKLILVDMYTDWCGYCKLMDRNVFSDDDYQKELQTQYVSVKIDGDSPFGRKFVTEYDVKGFPTFLFFDKEGNHVDEVEGYQDLKMFRKSTSKIYERNTSKRKLDKRYKKGKLSDTELAQYYSLSNSKTEKDAIYKTLSEKLSDEDLLSGPYDAFLFASSTDLDQRGSKLILTNKAVLTERNGVIVYEQFIEKLFNVTLEEAIQSGDEKELQQLEDELLPAYVNDELALPQAKLILRKLYHANRGEWTTYEEVVQKQWKAYPDSNQYYNEAYALLDGYVEDMEAMALAESWLTKSVAEQDIFHAHLLLAVVQLMQGKEVLGKQSLEKANLLAKTDEEKEQVKELMRMADEG